MSVIIPHRLATHRPVTRPGPRWEGRAPARPPGPTYDHSTQPNARPGARSTRAALGAGRPTAAPLICPLTRPSHGRVALVATVRHSRRGDHMVGGRLPRLGPLRTFASLRAAVPRRTVAPPTFTTKRAPIAPLRDGRMDNRFRFRGRGGSRSCATGRLLFVRHHFLPPPTTPKELFRTIISQSPANHRNGDQPVHIL